MSKRVLILGASRYYIRAIESAKRAGYYTLVIDRNIDSPGFEYAHEHAAVDITDFKGALKYAAAKKIDGIVALNDFGVYTAAYVSGRLNLPGLTVEEAEIATSKAKLREKWAEKGQPNPSYRIVRSLDECYGACRDIGFPVIFKPSVSMGGSRGVIFVDDVEKVEEAYAFSSGFYTDKTILVEEFMDGVEHSAEVLVYEGKGYVLAIADRSKTSFPARVDKNIVYPTRLTGERRRELERVIIDSVTSLGIRNGCAHVECCTLPSGEVKLFELGARPGGGGIPDPIVTYLTGVNEIEQYLKICTGDKPDHLAPLYERGCNYHFLTPSPGVVKRVSGLEDILTRENILDAALFVKPGDTIREIKIGADRSGFIIAGGEDAEEALRIGREAEEAIVIEYC